MILCSCNRLTHTDVAAAIDGGATRPCEVYERCGTRAECGGCVRSILAYLRQEAVASIATQGFRPSLAS